MTRSTPARLIAKIAALALAAGLVAAAPSPAYAVPTPVGEWVAATPRVLRTVVPDECRDVLELKVAVDLQGVGNAIAAQGYYIASGDPVYTQLAWDWDYRITGPANFYETGKRTLQAFPTAENVATVSVCPDEFAAGAVTPGVYTLETHLVVHNDFYMVRGICSAKEGCQDYPKLYEKTIVQQFSLAAEGPSPACVQAKSAVQKLKGKIKKAKRAHHKNKVRKLKRKLLAAKAKVEANC